VEQQNENTIRPLSPGEDTGLRSPGHEVPSQCGGEHQNEGGKCPTCVSPIQLVEVDKREPDQTRTGILPKSVGICPACGTEQVVNMYRIPPGIADFLRVKSTDTFVPDKHHCVNLAKGIRLATRR